MHALRRLLTLRQHVSPRFVYSTQAVSGISLTVTPVLALVDEKVSIRLSGLRSQQIVTLVAMVTDNGRKFESRGVYQANSTGNIDSQTDASIAGTFKGKEDMGLFWSLKPAIGEKPGLRLVKKDVCTPLDVHIHVYDGHHGNEVPITQTPVTSTKVQRLYKLPGVRRIPVQDGQFRGTIFVPEGKGPFPGLIDTYGGLVSLIETRAALLASRGYATFALSYLYAEGLPKMLLSANVDYFKDAAEWFSQQDYVDDTQLGAHGLCYGGFLSLIMAAQYPKIRAVVNVNGLSITSPDTWKTWNTHDHKDGKAKLVWPDPSKTYLSSEGIVIRDCFDTDSPECVPAWIHGAKVLNISGLDDLQINPKYAQYFYDHWPENLKENVSLVKYPGAGHLIEPPYSPLCRVVHPGRKRMDSIDFVPDEMKDDLMMAGGYPAQHAFAQEDSWSRILQFLEKTLKS